MLASVLTATVSYRNGRGSFSSRIFSVTGRIDPLKADAAIEEAKKAINQLHLFGFHFHPIMGHFSVDERRFYPLLETINELKVPVMVAE